MSPASQQAAIPAGERRDQIAEAALELVDREGLESLTMRRLAREVGMGTMTLYGYFRDKADLLDHAVERAALRQEFAPGGEDWKEDLRGLLSTMMRFLTEHPAVIRMRAGRPILSAGTLRTGETGLAILGQAGFDFREAAAAWRLLFTYVFGYAAFSAAEPGDRERAEWRQQLVALPAIEFPQISGNIEDFLDFMAGRQPFEEGLELILDGLEARLAKRGAKP